MPHETALIATVAAGIGVAFILGLAAVRLGLPPIIGYLVAGVLIGPFTPGYVADSGLAGQLAEFGVILLMFGVGLHFSLDDLVAVRGVVAPGALLQSLLTGSAGAALALWWGWGAGGAAVLGLSVSVASTVVLLKGLERRDQLDSPEGRLAVGWLVVEDVMMVVALVLLPALAPVLGGNGGAATSGGALALAVALAIAKVTGFVALMFFVGRRFVPWLLARVAATGSRELFTLSVLATALGIGTIAAELFGVSFALGAFFAGAVIAESALSHRAAADALPLQDAFAVLFFVSVGMLFDPSVVLRHPGQLAVLVLLVVVWKSVLATGLVGLFSRSRRAAFLVGPALGQIGEFSFIVAALGLSLGLVPKETQALIVATALVAITVNGPLLSATVRIAKRASGARDRERSPARAAEPATPPASSGPAEVVVIGYGRVGATVVDALTRAGATVTIVEEQERVVGGLRLRGLRAIQGDATRPEVLGRAEVAQARLLVITAPEPFRARRIAELSRQANPGIAIAVRTHSGAEQAFFESWLAQPGGSGRAVYAEREAALSLAYFALVSLGRSDDEADVVVNGLRGTPIAPTETFQALATTEYQALTRPAERDEAPR